MPDPEAHRPADQHSLEKPSAECSTVLTLRDQVSMNQNRTAGLYDLPANLGGGTSYVPISFHIVRTSDGTGGLDPTLLCDAMDAINTRFLGTQIEFYFAPPIDYIDSDLYFEDTGSLAAPLLFVNVVADAINVYFLPDLSVCGRSTFTTSGPQGIIMNNGCMPPDAPSTLPHEIGHYFDLLHTHETANGSELVVRPPDPTANCTAAGDLLCDTPADPGLGSSVTPYPSCAYTGTSVDQQGQPYVPDTRNLMSYAPSDCRDSMSSEQRSLALATLLNHRPELIHAAVPSDTDCNVNGITDICDTSTGTSTDCNGNGIPDECIAFEPDCDLNGIPDACEFVDCNGNCIADDTDISGGSSADCNANGVPDDCENDCNDNGQADGCDITDDISADTDGNGVPDECQTVHHVPATYATIQLAIDAAADLDIVMVAPGVYLENISIIGKSVSLVSSDGPANTILDGYENGTVVAIDDAGLSVLSGFTITNGYGTFGLGGGVDFRNCSLIIRNCRIVNNNAVEHGGGLEGRSGFLTMQVCEISGNRATANFIAFGAGANITNCRVEISNCLITDNQIVAPDTLGGGGLRLSVISGFIRHTTIAGNSAPEGGGVYLNSGAMLFDHTIIYGNSGLQMEGTGNATIRYSIIPGWTSGEGNSDADPLFVDPAGGDYHLGPDSPAVDAGDPAFTASAGETDYDGDPRVLRGIADIGADEFAADCNGNGVPDYQDIADLTTPDIDGNGVPDTCEDCDGNGLPDGLDIAQGTHQDCNGNSVPDECDIAAAPSSDCNSNGLPDECEFADCNGNCVPDTLDIGGGGSDDCNSNAVPDECEDCDANGTADECDIADGLVEDRDGNGTPDVCQVHRFVPTEYATIQSAIDAAVDGEIVEVTAGIYPENLLIFGKQIMLRAPDGPGVTTIDGGQLGSVLAYSGTESAVLEGFTITNGTGRNWEILLVGGGLYSVDSNLVVRDCVVQGNTLSAWFTSGAGIFVSRGNLTVLNCQVRQNMIFGSIGLGAGIACRDSAVVVRNSTITENENNGTDEFLGGVGGGMHFLNSDPVSIRNCTIAHNVATSFGTGVYWTTSDLTMASCIVHGNSPGSIVEMQGTAFSLNASYSNIGGGWAGTENTDVDPLFVDPAGGDFHIQEISPCVDTGDPALVVEAGETDIDGDLRILDGRVDKGADEFAACGDFTCSEGESRCNCPSDCGDAPSQETPSATCSDGADNDCDGLMDCADTDCHADPACLASIPTMATWGLAVMTLVLLTAGTIIMHRDTRRQLAGSSEQIA